MNLTELPPIQPTGSVYFDDQLAKLADAELDCGEEVIRIARDSSAQHRQRALQAYLNAHLISFDQEKIRRLQTAAVECAQLEHLAEL